jgi:crotonobetainyl-CoA:carnitine CoA-transferase CaiB-like acyl-CoA transferase
MYQVGAAMVPEAFLHHQTHGTDAPRLGARDADGCFSAVLPAGVAGRWLAVSARTRDELDALTDLVGSDRPLEQAVRTWASELDPETATQRLQGRGIPAGPVNDAGDLRRDPQLIARGFFEEVEIPALASSRPIIGRPFRWTSPGSGVGIRSAAPDMGADTRTVLIEAGLTADAIQRLYDDGVVADGPLDPPPARALDVDLLLSEGTLARVEKAEVLK